jgi:hypothetical protein
MSRERMVLTGIVGSVLLLSACTGASTEPQAAPPASVEQGNGTAQARVTLTVDAARHLGIETAEVRAARRSRGNATLVPYAAILYDPAGRTWVYTSPEPLVFVRQPIRVEDIRGRWAAVSSETPLDAPVVTLGGSELLGVEYGVGEE